MFDKDGDGTITEAEAGQFILDAGKALAMMGGKQIFRAIGYVAPSARDGEITRSEYNMMEDKIREGALEILEQINGSMPMVKSEVMSAMTEWESEIIDRVHQVQRMAKAGTECMEYRAEVIDCMFL